MSEGLNLGQEERRPDLPPGTFISVTSIKLKSVDPEIRRQFMGKVGHVMKQTRNMPGLLKKRVYLDEQAPTIFYTMTAWESREAMQGFRDVDSHDEAMRSGSELTSEGGVLTASWIGDTTPSLQEIKNALGPPSAN